jgi:hypothetical protein
MNLLQFKRRARRYLDAGITVQLYSPPGLGKSETTDALVDEYTASDGHPWGLATVMLAAYTPADVLGYLVPRDREVGGKIEAVSEFTMPPWMLSDEGKPLNEYKRGILFLDEWDKANPEVKRAAAEILLNGRAGRHQLHDGIGVITASNRAEDRSGSTKEFDFIINRRIQFHLQPDVDSWEDWAVRHGVNPLFIAFAKRNVDIVFSGKVPEKQGPFCTPRSLVMLSKLFEQSMNEHGSLNFGDRVEEAMLTEEATGLIGPEAANHLLTWCKIKTEVPDFVEIVKDPAGTEIPKKPDGKMLVCYDMAHRATVENIDPVVEYALRLPKEFQILFGAAAIKRNHRLISTKAFKDGFIRQNASLLNLIA